MHCGVPLSALLCPAYPADIRAGWQCWQDDLSFSGGCFSRCGALRVHACVLHLWVCVWFVPAAVSALQQAVVRLCTICSSYCSSVGLLAGRVAAACYLLVKVCSLSCCPS